MGFRPVESPDQVRDRVASANVAIVAANIDLVPSGRLEPFDPDDVVARWERLRARQHPRPVRER